MTRDFTGGPVNKASPSNAGVVGSVPGSGAKILHASWPKTTTTTTKNRSNTVTNSIQTFKIVTSKKNLKIKKKCA